MISDYSEWSIYVYSYISPTSQPHYYKPNQTCIITANYFKDFVIAIITANISNSNCLNAQLPFMSCFFNTSPANIPLENKKPHVHYCDYLILANALNQSCIAKLFPPRHLSIRYYQCCMALIISN